jgi:hypothetical protein
MRNTTELQKMLVIRNAATCIGNLPMTVLSGQAPDNFRLPGVTNSSAN